MIPEETILQQSRQELEIQWDGSRVLPLLRTIQKWKREQASREKELAYQYADLLENFQIKLDEGEIVQIQACREFSMKNKVFKDSLFMNKISYLLQERRMKW